MHTVTDLTAIFGPGGFVAQDIDIPAPGRGSKAAYAQLYASRGWHVLPLHGVEHGRCTCGRADCTSAGKHPRTGRGVKDATTDRGIIAGWWKAWPQANIGLATGRVSGFWVLDVDPRAGGEESLAELQDRLGGLPDTVMALTGGGGQHFLFDCPADCEIRGGANKLGPGLDVKGEGGYIVVEPSEHISGHAYTWEGSCDPLEGVAMLPAPQLVAELAVHAAQPLAPAAGDEPMAPYKVAELRSALACIPPDDRDTWLQVGMALHATRAGQQAFGLWCEWSQGSVKYDAADQRRVWDSFRRDAGGVTLSTIYGFAKRQGWTESGMTLPAMLPQETIPGTGFEFVPYRELVRDPQPPQWLITDFLERDTLAVLFGDSGTYKSFLALDIGLNVAAGRPWHGRSVASGAVFYVCGEGGGGIGRRVAAWQRRNQVEADLPFFASRHAAELTAVASAQAVSDACEALAQSCDREPVLIIVDTLAANFGGADENSTKDMNLMLTLVSRLLRERFRATVMLVHHVGHGDKARERGSYALRGNADTRIRVEAGIGLSSTLHCEKTKDSEAWQPMLASLEVVPLGIQDAEGRSVTSLAVASLSNESATHLPPDRTARGSNQLLALRTLRDLFIEHEANAGGREARVLIKDWRERSGLPKNRFSEVRKALMDAHLVICTGPHAALTPDGQAVAEAE